MTRIKAYKIDEQKNIIFSLSEFCPEGNLQEFLNRYDSLTETDVLLIFSRIMRSVIAIHDNGYIHGDLKLETISMCQNNIPKIKTFKNRVVKDSLASKRGTPFYMPPEALLDLFKPTLFFFQKSFDNYALGVILYFMLHYKFPFYGNTYEELLINMSNRRIKIDPDLSPLSKSLLSILLSYDINLRKDTKSIYQMVYNGVKNMQFSDFRKDVTTPLFEIYDPDEEVSEATKISSGGSSNQFKENKIDQINENIMTKDLNDSKFSNQYQKLETISEDENLTSEMGDTFVNKSEASESSIDHNNLFKNMIEIPQENDKSIEERSIDNDKGK
jgi:serine/threonine protein kinase